MNIKEIRERVNSLKELSRVHLKAEVRELKVLLRVAQERMNELEAALNKTQELAHTQESSVDKDVNAASIEKTGKEECE